MDVDSGRCSPSFLPFSSHNPVDIGEQSACADDVTILQIQKAAASLLVLHDSVDEDEIRNYLEQLESCVLHGNDYLVEYLERNQAHIHIQSVMKHVPSSLMIQQRGLKILHHLAVKSSSFRDMMIGYDCASQSLCILSTNPKDLCIQRHGLAILACFLETEKGKEIIQYDNLERCLIEVLVYPIEFLFEEREILRHALSALVFALELDCVVKTCVVVSYCDLLDERLQQTDDPDLQRLLLKSMSTISSEDKHRKRFVEKDCHYTTMEICSKIQTHEDLTVEAFGLLSILCKEDIVQSALVSYGFVQTSVQSILSKFRNSDKIQSVGFRIIESVVPLLMKDKSKSEEISKLIVRLAFTAMFSHINQPQIQIASCKTISTLLEHSPSSNCWIGENVEEKQEPLHTLCLGAIMVSRKNAQVFSAAAEAIYWIAAGNGRLCTSLMNKNVHIAIIEGLKRHKKNPTAVEKGCKALRGLCIFLPQHKNIMVNEGVFDILIDFLPRFKQHLDTKIEVISLIASLADIELVRHQCFVERFPELVVTEMTEHKTDPVLQEIGLETFAVLAAAEGGSEMLLLNGALFVTFNAMETFQDIALIQKKGLIILQVLANKQLVQDRYVRKRITDIIVSVMRDFCDVKAICSEVCVTIQLLAECDAVMSKEFVEKGCHEYLFSMLEDQDQQAGLQELASECLYVLSQEQNLKSAMLLSACKNGQLPATECLIELGADVNTGEGSSTPLYIAVCYKRHDVVQLIIKQVSIINYPVCGSCAEAAYLMKVKFDILKSKYAAFTQLSKEVNDMLTSLTKSLEQDSDEISGLLLKEIGYDKNAGVLSWSGLKLHSLKSSWILIALTSRPHSDFDTDGGRVFLEKIKNSELKRKRRKLAKSKSDSAVRVPIGLRLKLSSSTEVEDIAEIPESPKTAMVVPNISPFTTRRIYVRSKSYESMPSPSPRVARRPTLPTISALSPDNLEFDLSPTEEEVWRQTTYTGADVPYSYNDPRQQFTDSNEDRKLLASTEEVMWMRKGRKSPAFSTSSEDSVPPLFVGGRKGSTPDLDLNLTQNLQRRKTLGTLTDIVVSVPLPVKNKLIQLDVSNTCIGDIEALVSRDLRPYFIRLDTLDVSGNSIKELPSNLYKNLPALKTLHLSSNLIEVFPDSVLKCEHLVHLDLTHNKIKDLTIQTFCSSLKKLYLSHNNLKSLPREIGSYCHNLKELTLDDNAIQELPESFGLKDLRRLDLSKNQIDHIPENFLGLCQKLEELLMSDNQLKQLPSEVLSPHLTKLTRVKLKNNLLEEKSPFFVPRFILELPCLRSIDLSGNRLRGLPPLMMWQSNMMKDVMVSNNQITYLSLENAKVWSKLEKLHLGKNYLTELPKEIGQLTSLISLDISFNKGIVTLPDELGKCSKLYELNLDGLDLNIDATLLKRRVRDIISYLHNRLKKARCYYRMKLMVVGYGNRGKTTLLKTLMKRHSKRENKATVGVVVRDWIYTRYEKTEEDGLWFRGSGTKTEHTLSTWDFAGQEEFYSTHECYLSQRAVYLVVFDLRKGVADVENLKTWLASIRSHAQYCPVIVVGTHLDKLPKDETKNREEISKISEKLREFNTQPGLPTIHGDRVFLVDGSCENESVERLRNGIKKTVSTFEIRGIRVMGEKVPASYVKLSELLTEKAKTMTFPILRHREVMKLVHEADLLLDDEDELRQAVRFLHGAGFILHYDDMSMQLRDFYFIDPGWLCQMMAQVVTVRQINPFVSKDGIMKKNDIYILFKEKEQFPEYLVPQYIKLLEKFEIALPHSETELLIPCKLPTQKPAFRIPDQEKYSTIKRIYSMPHIPIGLRFRLIARLITLTKEARFKSELHLEDNPRQICWKTGIYMYWSEMAYFLHESNTSNRDGKKDELCFTVPKSIQGNKLLGQIVDCIDNLIEEWYPGLTNIDPLLGHEILEILVPCSQCTDQANCYMFTITDLQKEASMDDKIFCPTHKSYMFLRDLTPDLVLADVENHLQLDSSLLELEESPDKLLGDGGFGDVYRAKYGNKDVAVKLFKEIADFHPLKMLRQEATILRYLKHPSVVSLVAVGIRPPVLLLELAPCGTLGTLIKNFKGMKRELLHKIALQVTEGLVYLHDIMIVYRDMKPDNVLIFSTSVNDRVIAKISDYGIARFTYLQSLKAQEGTLAYRAPEVIRKENYQTQADIFSLGLTFYVMLSGRHPFDNFDSKGEMDRAISEGLPIPHLSCKLPVPWPDMQSLTLKCLRYSPDERPTAKQLYSHLRSAEMYCLQQIVNVSKSTTVECLTIQKDKRHSRIKIWIASGDSENFQLSFITVGTNQNETKGFLFSYGRIMCMEAISDHYLAVGTQRGRVWVFDTNTNTLVHQSAQLQDSVLCMKHSKGEREGGWLLVGLANGKIAVFPVNELISEEGSDPVCLYPGQDYEPVLCMEKLGKRIFLSCGTQIIILNTAKGIVIEKILETTQNRSPHLPPIYTLAVLKGQILYSKKGTSVIEIWDSTKDTVRHTFDVREKMHLSKPGSRVTALSADSKSIWVGTHSGHIGIFDLKTLDVLAIVHRYERAVRSLLHVYSLGSSKFDAVLSGGLGFRDTTGAEKEENSMCGCLLVWDAEYPKYAKSLTEYELKRRELDSVIYRRTSQ